MIDRIAVVLAVVLMGSCSTKHEAAQATDTSAWFWCYPDKLNADGSDAKIGECAPTHDVCATRSVDWHHEDLCYRQEVAYCYIEEAISLGTTVTCTPAPLTCNRLLGTGRTAGECRRRLASEKLPWK